MCLFIREVCARDEDPALFLGVHVPGMERRSSTRALGRLATLIGALVVSSVFWYGMASQAYCSSSSVVGGSFR